MSRKTVRRVLAVPVSLALAVVLYYFFTWATPQNPESAEIIGVGTFITSMIAFFGGMKRPQRSVHRT